MIFDNIPFVPVFLKITKLIWFHRELVATRFLSRWRSHALHFICSDDEAVGFNQVSFIGHPPAGILTVLPN